MSSPASAASFVVGNFVETLPATSSRYVTQFYESSKEIEQAYADWRHALALGDRARAKALREAGRGKLEMHGAVGETTRRLTALNKLERRIEMDQEMSPEEKRRRLDMLDEMKHVAAKRHADLLRSREAGQRARP